MMSIGFVVMGLFVVSKDQSRIWESVAHELSFSMACQYNDRLGYSHLALDDPKRPSDPDDSQAAQQSGKAAMKLQLRKGYVQ